MDGNAIGKQLVDAAVQIHRELGPGLLETVYEVVLARELESRGLNGLPSRAFASLRLGVRNRPEPNQPLEGMPDERRGFSRTQLAQRA